MFLKVILFVFLSWLAETSSQNLILPVYYDVANPVSFNGSNLTANSIGCKNTLNGVLADCNSSAKLTDSEFGSMDPLTDQLDQFFAFSRFSGSDSRATFIFNASFNSTVILHFFNSPSLSIGLPVIRVVDQGQPVLYYYSSNDDLMHNDSQMRSVVLNLHPNKTLSIYQFDFLFSNSSKINWFLVSEVQFYNGTPPIEDIIFKNGDSSVLALESDNIQSSITLSCTVLNNGSFQWEWLYNGEQITPTKRIQVYVADATRTSMLYISQLSYFDRGNYACTVRSFFGQRKQRQIYLEIAGTLDTYETLMLIDCGNPVSISCKTTGYLLSTEIEWRRNTVIITSDDHNYIIESSFVDQANMTTLSILNGDTGRYSCAIAGRDLQRVITVSIKSLLPDSSTLPFPSVMYLSSPSLSPSLSPSPSVIVYTLPPQPSSEQSCCDYCDDSLRERIMPAWSVILIAVLSVMVIITIGLLFVLCMALRQKPKSSQNESCVVPPHKTEDNGTYEAIYL